MKHKLDYSKVIQKFKDDASKFEKLGVNLVQALELLLNENGVPYLSVNYRTKHVESFVGKIERKNYKNPLEEIEDICGVRIICFYQSDVERIKEIIIKEFEVVENVNKEDDLEFDQFGYRSMHFIVKIKNQWITTPNYRGLEDLKAELQIRTVLMHAWAEIEHKLAYKSKSQIPKEFRRKLSRISAKLEESDEQFEDIKNQIELNKLALIESAIETKGFDINAEFNLDNLQAFLDYAFSDRAKNITSTRHLFEEMNAENITFKSLILGYENTKGILEDVEKETAKAFYKGEYEEGIQYIAQVGLARTVLDLVDEKYFDERIKFRDDEELEILYKYKKSQ